MQDILHHGTGALEALSEATSLLAAVTLATAHASPRLAKRPVILLLTVTQARCE